MVPLERDKAMKEVVFWAVMALNCYIWGLVGYGMFVSGRK